MSDLLKKLEEVKLAGNYAVGLAYGENVGCDDLDTKKEDRQVQIYGSPVGYLGGLRVLWKGKVSEVDSFDVNSTPKRVNNPPSHNDLNDSGYYIWGTSDNIDSFLKDRKS